eukprot:CAMPEP_0196207830 /NCGR_PEP_ID=MMETSP0912-20130531/8665_1 /TAXON_ID=49265 /ORGANISM="Thalassiosira rotula, Strain GSO102" /LENGTH=367 /DNA_ID=CAMNT_0041482549 /DNA_START=134 /DNA_END=1234 /DNA_ORIENTATION=+
MSYDQIDTTTEEQQQKEKDNRRRTRQPSVKDTNLSCEQTIDYHCTSSGGFFTDDDDSSYSEDDFNDGATIEEEEEKPCYHRNNKSPRRRNVYVVVVVVVLFLSFCFVFYAKTRSGREQMGVVQKAWDEESNSIMPTIEIKHDSTQDIALQNTTDTGSALTSLTTVSGNDLATGRGKSYGILFDVEATPSLSHSSSAVIAGMDLCVTDTTLSTHYEIWTKNGSWQENIALTTEPAAYLAGFRKVSNGSIPGKKKGGGSAQHSGVFSTIPLGEFQDVKIKGGGARQAFWITLSDDILMFQSYADEESIEGESIVGKIVSRHDMKRGGIVQALSAELRIYYGAAVRAYPLKLADAATDFWDNAGFLGRIW